MSDLEEFDETEIADSGQRCRGCGCDELHPCVDKEGDTCIWATPDLCSFCALRRAA